MAGAQPTTATTTSDDSRGGVFTSNAEVGVSTTSDASRGGVFTGALPGASTGSTGTTTEVNNNTITIRFNSESAVQQVVQFTLNQDEDGSFDITLPEPGDTDTDTNTHLQSGVFDRARQHITLTLTDGETVVVDLSSLITELEAAEGATADELARITALEARRQLPQPTEAGQFLQTSGSANNIIFGPAPTVDASLTAVPTGGATTSGISSDFEFTRFAVDPNLTGPNGRRLVLASGANGLITLGEDTTIPPIPTVEHRLDTSMDHIPYTDLADITLTLTVTNVNTLNGVRQVGAVVRDSDGTPLANISSLGSSQTGTTFTQRWTVPQASILRVDDYTATITFTATDTVGNVQPQATETSTFSIFPPAFWYRSTNADFGTTLSDDNLMSLAANTTDIAFALPITMPLADATGNVFLAVPIPADGVSDGITEALIHFNNNREYVRAGFVRGDADAGSGNHISVTGDNGIAQDYSVIRFGGSLRENTVIEEFET